MTPSSVTYAYVTVTGPSSYSTYVFCYVSNGGCELLLNNLPAAGTYTVTAEPEGAATMTFTATLAADVTGTPDFRHTSRSDARGHGSGCMADFQHRHCADRDSDDEWHYGNAS